MKNRTIIGVICIAIALVVTFAVAPLVNKAAESKVDVIVLKKDVAGGHTITNDDIEVRTMYKRDVPTNAITDKKKVVNMFARSDLVAGYWLTDKVLTKTSDSATDVFKTLDENNQAVSITIPSFAGGLSGKLENGDIVSISVYYKEKAFVPEELKYVRVITTTTAKGWDKDEIEPSEDGTYELPTTLTLLATPRQAQTLIRYENLGVMHAALICRDDEKKASEYLSKQEEILLQIELEELKEDEELEFTIEDLFGRG